MNRLINSLTKDEDLRQDLWVEHLSGTPSSHLIVKAYRYLLKERTEYTCKDSLHEILSNPPAQEFIDSFSDLEKEVMCLILIGYNIGEISVHLGISQVQLDGLLLSIRSNRAWYNLWHSKEILAMKKDSA